MKMLYGDRAFTGNGDGTINWTQFLKGKSTTSERAQIMYKKTVRFKRLLKFVCSTNFKSDSSLILYAPWELVGDHKVGFDKLNILNAG